MFLGGSVVFDRVIVVGCVVDVGEHDMEGECWYYYQGQS